MPVLVPIVEGDGEVDAVPLLLRRVLHEELQRYDVAVARPKDAHGRGNLTSPGKINKFIRHSQREPDAAGILVLLDAEADIPCALACELRERICAISPRLPVAIVCAQRQYQSWFLATLHTIAGEALGGRTGIAQSACHAGPPEAVPNPKRWITGQMPRGRIYKETQDQAPMTSLMDLQALKCASKSFRRLVHAVEELLDAHDGGQRLVTPTRCESDRTE